MADILGDTNLSQVGKEGPRHAATFTYDRDAKHDVSLSMTREEQITRRAPQNFLNGLIPEDPGTRENVKLLVGARSSGAWDLLSAVESDLPGGIVLTQKKEPVDRGTAFSFPAQDSEVAARIESIYRGGSGLGDFDAPPRFSLAGVQGKFALAMERDEIFWPDAATPSTHIVKPARKEHPGLNQLESVSLHLAQLMGVQAAGAEVMTFQSQQSFVTTRFDRRVDKDGNVVRVHMEDVAQALAVPPEKKYHVGAPRTIRLLQRYGRDADTTYDFVKQLAFNIAIGNADAHAKNYTLMHGASGVTLSAIYDTVPIAMFPEYEQKLGMRVGNQRKAFGVTLDNWKSLSKKTMLDYDRVESIITRLSERFLDHAEATIGQTELGKTHRGVLDQLMRSAERNLRHRLAR
ncbi:HipA domain-containing protein [Leucobacter sp. HY1910]